MAADSVQFGSHTVSHRCLAQLGAEDLRYELIASRQRLESELGIPVTALAYPFGGATAYNAAVIAAARAAGYRMATTYIPGVKELPAPDPFRLAPSARRTRNDAQLFRGAGKCAGGI